MNKDILENLLRAQAFAQVELGLGRQEFDELTPAEFEVYLEIWKSKREREDLYASMTPTMLANINRDSKKKPQGFKYFDFMPYYGPALRKTHVEQTAHTTIDGFLKDNG